ncbi:MAG: lysylphosphatidylglycerol synthase transmembrane domain-containing protein [Acidobacteriota bacterium]
MKQIVKVTAILAVAAGLLAWFFGQVDAAGVIAALRQMNGWWMAGALFFTLAHYALRAWRWRLLMTPIRPHVPYRSLLDAVLAGYAVTFLVTRVGEIVRPAYLARRERLPFAGTLMTVGLDRLLDAGAIAVLLVSYFLMGPVSGPGALAPGFHGPMRTRGVIAGGVIVAVFGILALLARRRRKKGIRPEDAQIYRGGLARWTHGIMDGLGVLESGRGLAGAGLQSIVIWLVLCAQVFCGVRAFGIDLPYVASFVVIPFLALGIAMPLPGGVGGYHAAGRFALVQVLGVGQTVAVTSILVLHLVSVLPAILLGSWVIARDGVSVRELVRSRPESHAGASGHGAPSEADGEQPGEPGRSAMPAEEEPRVAGGAALGIERPRT